MKPDLNEAARQVDWVRRAFVPCRDGVVMREIPMGWLSVRPSIPCGEFPSSPGNRASWHAPGRPIRGTDIDAAIEATRVRERDQHHGARVAGKPGEVRVHSGDRLARLPMG